MNEQALTYLRYIHGSYNSLVTALFIYQGLLGLKIRMERKKRGKQHLNSIRRHRKTGPVLVLMGIAGFFAGLTLVYIEHGNILEFPYHLITGSVLMAAIIAQFSVSRRIKPPDSRIRNIHFAIGITIICLYFIQILLGINVLKQHDHKYHADMQQQQKAG